MRAAEFYHPPTAEGGWARHVGGLLRWCVNEHGKYFAAIRQAVEVESHLLPSKRSTLFIAAFGNGPGSHILIRAASPQLSEPRLGVAKIDEIDEIAMVFAVLPVFAVLEKGVFVCGVPIRKSATVRNPF